MSMNSNILEKCVNQITWLPKSALYGLQVAKLRFSNRFMESVTKKIYVGLAFIAEIS